MKNIYWIEGPWSGRLAIVARPRGHEWLEDEVLHWRKNGIDVVVSLLTHPESQELGLAQEATVIAKQGLQFIGFPIADRDVPVSIQDTRTLVARLANLLSQGKRVAVHCRQGIGRSSLLVASLLVDAGVGVEQAFRQIEIERGYAVPDTVEQKQWVARFAATVAVPALLGG